MRKNFFKLLLFCMLSSSVFAVASWYGNKFEGRISASGYIYSQNSLSCASNDYPFGTVLKVINKKNNKSVIVVVLDRGSFKEKYGRRVDLSKAAFSKIAKPAEGLISVKIEVLSKKHIFKYKHGKPKFTEEEYKKYISDIKNAK